MREHQFQEHISISLSNNLDKMMIKNISCGKVERGEEVRDSDGSMHDGWIK